LGNVTTFEAAGATSAEASSAHLLIRRAARWAVAGRAVKVAATLGLDKIKAFGKFIHVYE
jgi:hypothetical protein